MTTFNVLLLGETVGNSSVIDLIIGHGDEESSNGTSARTSRTDAHEVTLGGKKIVLHAFPSLEPSSDIITTAAASVLLEPIFRDYENNSGIQLIVYFEDASCSDSWHGRTYGVICSTLPPNVPIVAVVTGPSGFAEQERWWSMNEPRFFAQQRTCFAELLFLPTIANDPQSSFGDYPTESRRLLHALIQENCVDNTSSPDQGCQPASPYTPISRQSSFSQRLGTPSRRNLSLTTLFATASRTNVQDSAKATNVILVGESGVGKSSIINLVAGRVVARVSPDTMACTQETKRYTVKEKGRTFHLYDTPGLADPQMDVDDFLNSIEKARQLIQGMNGSNGPDLLLFCVHKPTIALQRNYRLFREFVCGSRVPFALVITKLKGGEKAEEWWENNVTTIKKYGVDFAGYAGFSSVRNHSDGSPGMDEKSRQDILSLLLKCADGRNTAANQVRSSARRSLGAIASIMGWALRRDTSLESTLMNRCELEVDTARKLAVRLASPKASI
ncbi:hypothetical protein HYDPIDRAFT_26021 [Hydnomerulius pinastri MD-312]|nr:hypothetical protein HYDPIDRAFT_26021 [Hydnomerulius pinastri MD-312]